MTNSDTDEEEEVEDEHDDSLPDLVRDDEPPCLTSSDTDTDSDEDENEEEEEDEEDEDDSDEDDSDEDDGDDDDLPDLVSASEDEGIADCDTLTRRDLILIFAIGNNLQD